MSPFTGARAGSVSGDVCDESDAGLDVVTAEGARL